MAYSFPTSQDELQRARIAVAHDAAFCVACDMGGFGATAHTCPEGRLTRVASRAQIMREVYR